MPARLAEDSWRWHRGWFQGVLAQLIGRADSSACSHFFFPFTVPLIFVCLRRLGMEICGCFAGTRCSHPIIFCTDYSIQSLEKDSWREKEQERYVSILNHDSLLIHFFSLMFFFRDQDFGFSFLASRSRTSFRSRSLFDGMLILATFFGPPHSHGMADGLMLFRTELAHGLVLSLSDSCSLWWTHARFTDSWLFFAHGLASLMDRCSLWWCFFHCYDRLVFFSSPLCLVLG